MAMQPRQMNFALKSKTLKEVVWKVSLKTATLPNNNTSGKDYITQSYLYLGQHNTLTTWQCIGQYNNSYRMQLVMMGS